MRIFVALAGTLVLAACATPEPKAAPPPQKKVAVTKDNLAGAVAGKKKIVDEKGRTLYCKTETKTGSRLDKQTTCLTEEQWDRVAEQSARQMERAAGTPMPTPGH